MKWAVSLTCFAFVAAEPDVAGALKKIASDIKSHSADAGPDVQALLTKAVDTGIQQLAAAGSREALQQDAFLMVSKRLRTYFKTAGCARNFTQTCPLGWSLTGALCVPDVGTSTLCGSADLRYATVGDLNAFAYSCAAEYPCGSPCLKDYGAPCPA